MMCVDDFMMISPEEYYNQHFKGKTAGQINPMEEEANIIDDD